MTDLLYLSLHNQLVKKFGVNAIITRKEFYIKIGRHNMIPKSKGYLVVDEMVKRKLIKKLNRDNLRILNCKTNFTE